MPFDPLIVPRPQPGFQSSPVRATVDRGPRDGRSRPARRSSPVRATVEPGPRDGDRGPNDGEPPCQRAVGRRRTPVPRRWACRAGTFPSISHGTG